MYKEIILKNVKDVLFYAYDNDFSFPKDGDMVSMILTYLFGSNTNFTQKYDVNYVRGYFKSSYKDSLCNEHFKHINRKNFRNEEFDNFNCHNYMSCNIMFPHSWIEIRNKSTSVITILDFTSIQFEEEYPTYHNDLLGEYDLESLYSYIEKRSKFVVKESESIFNCYIPLIAIENYQYIIKKTNELIGTKYTNPILDYLDN